jgi:hypothetical protein
MVAMVTWMGLAVLPQAPGRTPPPPPRPSLHTPIHTAAGHCRGRGEDKVAPAVDGAGLGVPQTPPGIVILHTAVCKGCMRRLGLHEQPMGGRRRAHDGWPASRRPMCTPRLMGVPCREPQFYWIANRFTASPFRNVARQPYNDTSCLHKPRPLFPGSMD